ncbi:hypothetical protein CERZMDRAFT_92984 [Cercospora zeae-maydis SCOH1-5]|uniref:Uncharacterized protein n=1 Tax=Cercospora zeae-maydis SCOH1-5 TaxID=717836 RepID=A0A6A6FTZ9_9PEZI|nr:hypothetical protein CERZMDRAFT_92984 [Cercospora zeae-maydis SCOH1-5]
MDDFLSPSDFDIRFPLLSQREMEAEFDLAISHVQNQTLRVHQKAWERSMHFSEWWYFALTMCKVKIWKPRISAQEEQARRVYRYQLRSNAIRRQDVNGFFWMTVEWGGDSSSTLSLPPLVAPGAKYVSLEYMWPHLVRDARNTGVVSQNLEPKGKEIDDAAFDAVDFTFEDLLDLDEYHVEDSISDIGQQNQLQDSDSAVDMLSSTERHAHPGAQGVTMVTDTFFPGAEMITKRSTSSGASQMNHRRSRRGSEMHSNAPALGGKVQTPNHSTINTASGMSQAEEYLQPMNPAPSETLDSSRALIVSRAQARQTMRRDEIVL